MQTEKTTIDYHDFFERLSELKPLLRQPYSGTHKFGLTAAHVTPPGKRSKYVVWYKVNNGHYTLYTKKGLPFCRFSMLGSLCSGRLMQSLYYTNVMLNGRRISGKVLEEMVRLFLETKFRSQNLVVFHGNQNEDKRSLMKQYEDLGFKKIMNLNSQYGMYQLELLVLPCTSHPLNEKNIKSVYDRIDSFLPKKESIDEGESTETASDEMAEPVEEANGEILEF